MNDTIVNASLGSGLAVAISGGAPTEMEEDGDATRRGMIHRAVRHAKNREMMHNMAQRHEMHRRMMHRATRHGAGD